MDNGLAGCVLGWPSARGLLQKEGGSGKARGVGQTGATSRLHVLAGKGPGQGIHSLQPLLRWSMEGSPPGQGLSQELGNIRCLIPEPLFYPLPQELWNLPAESKTLVSNRPRVQCRLCSFYLSCMSLANDIVSPSLSFPICEIGITPPQWG